jgi:hypothetical protein
MFYTPGWSRSDWEPAIFIPTKEEEPTKVDQVLNEYRRGGADKRMSLFLYHCELRDAFESIERDDPMDLQEAPRRRKGGKEKRKVVLNGCFCFSALSKVQRSITNKINGELK